MKKLNKIFAVLMSVIAVGIFADTAVSAEMYGDIEYSEYNSEVHIYKYIGSETNVDIPDEINGKKVTEINQSAFQECKSLTSVTIPDSVTSIGMGAFGDCTSLKNISIGSGMKKIGSTVFYKCDNISDVYFNGSEAQWNSIEIGYNNNTLTNASIHYNSKMPEELMEESKAVIENSIDTASQNPIEKQNTNNGINMIIIILAVVALGGIIVTVIFLRKKNMK